MKTPLAIVLATIALTFGDVELLRRRGPRFGSPRVSPGVYNRPHYPPQTLPGALTVQSLGSDIPASPPGEAGWTTRSNGSAKCGSPRRWDERLRRRGDGCLGAHSRPVGDGSIAFLVRLSW